MKLHYLIVLVCTSAIAGCKTMPATSSAFVQSSPDAPLVHSSSRFSFPKQIDNFQRERALQYDQLGEDVSVGYNDLNYNSPVAATVYVYPVRTSSLSAEFLTRQAELVTGHAGAHLVSTSTIVVSPGHVSAMAASYTFTDIFAGVSQPLKSVLLVAEVGKRYIEYRFTYPASSEQASSAEVATFERDFAWP